MSEITDMTKKELFSSLNEYVDEINKLVLEAEERYKLLWESYEELDEDHRRLGYKNLELKEENEVLKQEESETQKAYDLGHEDGEKSMQEKVNKLCEYWINNKTSTIIELFGGMTWEQIFGDVETAYNKVMYYENEKEEIHVGDVVKDIVGVKTLLVTNVVNSYVYTLDKDGRDGVRNKNDVVKTGEHYPLDEFLKGLK